MQPEVLSLSEKFQEVQEFGTTTMDRCSVWGPTCDSIDCVQPLASLPTELLKVGDWLRWKNMGAYTICAASQFNGFRRSEVRYTVGDSSVEKAIFGLMEIGAAGRA